MLSARRAEGRIARKGCTFSRVSAGGRAACAPRHQRGYSLSEENTPFESPRERRGESPSTPTLRDCSSKSCAACGIRCGVHGFAMNPCESLPVATAPYCREARVTVPRRQTACRMQHCCARRIVECSVRRKLGCTTTRLAERQRMIEAEANRFAGPLAVSEAMPPRR